MYYVMCRVSGGITGSREGLLKGHDGQVKEFETWQEAKDEADMIMAGIRLGNSTASFQYWPVYGEDYSS